MSITVAHPDANTYTVRLAVVGGLVTDLVEWQIGQYPDTQAPGIPGIWVLNGHKVVDTLGVRADIVFDSGGGAYEYAIQLGTAALDGALYGNAHGNELVASAATFSLDGVPLSIGIGQSITGSVLSVVQQRTILNPATSLVAGSVRVVHDFCAAGLYVRHTHRYLPGTDVVDTGYGMMLPINGSSIDRFQVGAAPVVACLFDNGTKGPPSQATQIEFSSTQHRYRSRLILPTGSPNLLSADGLSHVAYGGGWSQTSTGIAAFVIDRALPNGPKGYVPFQQYAYDGVHPRGRAAATTSAHGALYQVGLL